jgi:hypothetical protein
MGILVAGMLLHAVPSEVVHPAGAAVGAVPAGWSVAMTHVGAPPRWEIVRDDSAPDPPLVLAQTSADATAGRFPLAIWARAVLRDGEVSVAFKAVAGSVDRAAGIVWRYQDPNNYYIVRANALENNVVLYKVENGVRLSIAPKGLPSRASNTRFPADAGMCSRSCSRTTSFSCSSTASSCFRRRTKPSSPPAGQVSGPKRTARPGSTNSQL